MHARADAHPLPGFLAVHADGLTLAVKVTPRAPHDEIVPPGDNDRELRVKVTAPPVDAAANEALLRLLAEKLDCPRGAVQLLRGLTSRHKVVKLRGLSTAVVLAKLSDAK
ncbi:MAG: DUF167 domain-containing protein [Pedosphaera sp.]|nr:DUF167 domain-containing protein [Pedosphaera sp.]